MDQELENEFPEFKSTKESRWDRIRRRNTNAINGESETSKKLIEMDFIGKKNYKILNGEIDAIDKLDPSLVMNVRHDMIQRAKKKAYVKPIEREMALDRLRAHNASVENHYIQFELDKLKSELDRNRIKNLKRPKLCLNLSNKKIMKNIQNCSKTLKDFYAVPIEEMNKANRVAEDYEEILKRDFPKNMIMMAQKTEIVNNDEENDEEIVEQIVESKSDSNLSVVIDSTPVIANFVESKEKQEENDEKQEENTNTEVNGDGDDVDRCVRFEESVELHNYYREDSFCSTSAETESIISELAEEIMEEVQKETNIEMIGKQFDSLQITAVQNGNGNDAENIKILHKKKYNKDDYDEELCFAVNDDLLRIKRIEPSNIQLTVEMNANDDSEQTTPSQSETPSNSEQNAIIADLFKPRYPKDEDLLKKYFLHWIHFTTIEKIEKENFSKKTNRINQINAFLDQIRRRKNKIAAAKNQYNPKEFEAENGAKSIEDRTKNVVITKKYQTKIKVQQDIIDLQKLKLEKQERIIMELKLNRLTEDAKISKKDIKQELKQVIRTGAPKNQSIAKSLQLVGNLRDKEDEDEFEKLRGRAYLIPKFLERMQERALERSVKHEQAKQRRLQKEAEKEAAKIAADEAKRAEDEETKRLRIEALKEKRRLEKLAKLQKERDRKRYFENVKKSQEFCRQRTLRRFGMVGFKDLLARKRENYRKSEEFRKTLIKRNYLKLWSDLYFTIWEKRNQRSDNLYRKIMKRKCIRAWMSYTADERSKYYVAIDWHSFKITEKIYNCWLQYTKSQKVIEDTKLIKAEAHFRWHLKWKVLDRWQRLQQIMKLEHETEARREKWRLKIWELLPDYEPNVNTDL